MGLSLVELLLIGIGLSMDAFAVAVCKGLNMRQLNYKHGFIIALFFGGFQAGMPLIGWLLGRNFESYITSFDHWIAFILLGFLGGKMLFEAFKKDDVSDESVCSASESSLSETSLDIKELFLLAIATSIDALAVGITFAFLKTNIWSSVSIIGIFTFILSFIGVVIGNKFGNKFEKKAEIAGGAILILIGLKILLEHLGVISF